VRIFRVGVDVFNDVSSAEREKRKSLTKRVGADLRATGLSEAIAKEIDNKVEAKAQNDWTYDS
jgi:hypothetical protein